jgi:hypothetical protein
MKNGGNSRRLGDTSIGELPMAATQILLWISVAAMVGLTFVWPALAPQSHSSFAYQVAAVAALWIFLAALTALLWQKACKAPRT